MNRPDCFSRLSSVNREINTSWFEDGKIKLNINPEETMNVIYRGWMMTVDTYQLFCLALMEKRMHLINEAKEYD